MCICRKKALFLYRLRIYVLLNTRWKSAASKELFQNRARRRNGRKEDVHFSLSTNQNESTYQARRVRLSLHSDSAASIGTCGTYLFKH